MTATSILLGALGLSVLLFVVGYNFLTWQFWALIIYATVWALVVANHAVDEDREYRKGGAA